MRACSVQAALTCLLASRPAKCCTALLPPVHQLLLVCLLLRLLVLWPAKAPLLLELNHGGPLPLLPLLLESLQDAPVALLLPLMLEAASCPATRSLRLLPQQQPAVHRAAQQQGKRAVPPCTAVEESAAQCLVTYCCSCLPQALPAHCLTLAAPGTQPPSPQLPLQLPQL